MSLRTRFVIVRPLLALLALAGIGPAAAQASVAPAKRVALVFDDGPRPGDAPALLAVLAAAKVPATFSLVGARVKESPDLARAIAKAGHEIANHSATHAHPRDLDDAALDHEVADAQARITAATGAAPRWYWPPYLETDDRLRAAVKRAGLAIYTPHHLIVSMDFDRAVPAAEIRRRATTDVRDGTVILFHEWRAETRAELPGIVAELRRQGCTFFTFSGLHDALAADPAAVPEPPHPASDVPAGGEPLLTGELADFRVTTTPGNQDAIRVSTVDVTGQSFARALRIETSRDLGPAWAVELRTALLRAVHQGDSGLLRFHVRSVASADETGDGQVRVVVQAATEPHAKSLEQTATMRGAWQEFMLPFSFAEDHGLGAAELAFGFGFKRETVEIGGIEVLDFGTAVARRSLPTTRFTYSGREPDAPWRRAALARIEQIRKSDFRIEVRDAAGRPADGAAVHVEEVRSAFQFGSALQFERLVHDSPDNRVYRRTVLELFNAASPENDLKWAAWNGEWEGPFSQAQSLKALRWLQEHQFHIRGHVLVWPGWKNLPPSIVALRGTPRQSEIPGLVLAHIADITQATRGFVQEWDVLNEPYDNHDLMDLFGAGIMVTWFKAAAEGAPGVPLYLNDYSNHDLVTDRAHGEHFLGTAKYLLAQGAPLGGLGLQAHIAAQPNPPEHVLAALDTYAALKLPIRFTEFDVDTEDEALQADYTRDFLILAYSHPSVVGLQHWGFWAGAHWRPNGALFRADWSEKPAGKAYRFLVLDQWRTRQDARADARGEVAGRGFHGDYVVTVERDGHRAEQRFRLRPEEATTTVVVTLP